MDFVVDQYFPIVDALEDDLDALEDDIFNERITRDTTMRIYTLKRDLLEIKRGVSPLVDICNRLMRSDLDLIPDDARPYFRDVYDHAIRINEKVDGLRELLSTALEANLFLTTIAQNEATKRITGWARHLRDPHHDRGDLRHELRGHARAALALRLPRGHERDGTPLRLSLLPVQALRLALIESPRPCASS
jgi:hypothetical protein